GWAQNLLLEVAHTLLHSAGGREGQCLYTKPSARGAPVHANGSKRRPSAVRIAQVAPLYERVPPKLYGGTERVVAYLTDELVRQGHDVTLFSSGGSITRAEHVALGPCAIRLDPDCRDSLCRHFVLLERVSARLHEFDLVHFHIAYLHFPLPRRYGEPNLTPLHGRLDLPELADLYREYPGMAVASISNAQRKPLPGLNWQG